MRITMPYRRDTFDPYTGAVTDIYRATHAPGQGGSSGAAISVLSNWPKFNPDSREGNTMPTNTLAATISPALLAQYMQRAQDLGIGAQPYGQGGGHRDPWAEASRQRAAYNAQMEWATAMASQPEQPISQWQLYTDRMRREDEERAERQRLQQNQQRTFDRNWDWGAEDRRTSQMTPNPGESWDRFAMRLPVGMQGGGPGGGGGGGGFGVDARNFAEDQRRFNVTQANQQAALRARLDALRGLFGQGGGGGGMGGPPQGAPQQENPFLAQAARQGGPDRGELQNFLARLMQRGG